VWDSNQNNPNAVEDDLRTKMMHKDDAVRIGRFGGEGTGGQSFFDYDWKIGETYRFMVTAKTNGDRTEYAGHFFVPETKAWKHLVTFSTVTKGKPLSGYYSFVEDFKRDRISATKVRQAEFGNGWVLSTEGKWLPLNNSRFTADSNPATNINSGPVENRFYLTTGGDTENTDVKLYGKMERPHDPNSSPPKDLPKPETTASPARVP
jgi:hypothetical protein